MFVRIERGGTAIEVEGTPEEIQAAIAPLKLSELITPDAQPPAITVTPYEPVVPFIYPGGPNWQWYPPNFQYNPSEIYCVNTPDGPMLLMPGEVSELLPESRL